MPHNIFNTQATLIRQFAGIFFNTPNPSAGDLTAFSASLSEFPNSPIAQQYHAWLQLQIDVGARGFDGPAGEIPEATTGPVDSPLRPPTPSDGHDHPLQGDKPGDDFFELTAPSLTLNLRLPKLSFRTVRHRVF